MFLETNRRGLAARVIVITLAAGALSYGQSAGRAVDLRARQAGPGDLSVSYILPNGNRTAVLPGQTIPFGSAAVGTSLAATIAVVNSGTTAGTFGQAAVEGGSYRLSGLPLLPASIAPGAEIRFTLTFTPSAPGAAPGSLQLTWEGQTFPFTVSGTGTQAVWEYSITIGETTAPVAAGGAIDFSTVDVQSSKIATLRVRNAGNTTGRITTVQTAGADFRLNSVLALPANLAPGESFFIPLAFTPARAGTSQGSLTIDGVTFALTGVGQGAQLQLTFTLGPVSTPIAPNGVMNFPNTTVGKSATATLALRNTGNRSGAVSSISVNGTAFAVGMLPTLPSSIAASETISFQLTFTPSAVGAVTQTLQIDELVYQVRGVGSAPPAVGAVQWTGANGPLSAMQQASIGLSLAEPYESAITGTLTMTFASDAFGDDPAAQFAAGGRAISFQIPANTTQAVFGVNATAAPFQTGSVAGTIQFAATFAVAGANATPQPPPSVSMTVQTGPPQLRSLQIGTRSGTTVELLISGYSPSRTVRQIEITLTGAPGEQLTTTRLSADVDSAFTNWFQSTASRPFGSQFTASITLAILGDANAIQSVGVTASSAMGSSQTVSTALR